MKEGRLNLRLKADLLEGMKEYAERHHTTVTVLVERFFIKLLEEDKTQRVEAEQI